LFDNGNCTKAKNGRGNRTADLTEGTERNGKKIAEAAELIKRIEKRTAEKYGS